MQHSSIHHKKILSGGHRDEFDIRLREAALPLSAGLRDPRRAESLVRELFGRVGVSPDDLIQRSPESIRDEYVGMAPKFAAGLGIIGRALLEEGKHLEGLAHLEHAANIGADPLSQKKILFGLSNMCHSVQRTTIQAALYGSLKRDPLYPEILAERVREQVLGLKASYKLLPLLGIDPKTYSVERCEFKHEGLWLLSNLTHYYFTLGKLRDEAGQRLSSLAGEFQLDSPECYRRALKYSRAILNHFDFPSDEYLFGRNWDSIKSHRFLKDSLPDTVAGALCLRAEAFEILGDAERGMICATLAHRMSPSSSIAQQVFRSLRTQTHTTAGEIELLLRKDPPIPPELRNWELIEKQLGVGEETAPDMFKQIVGQHFSAHAPDRASFVRYYRNGDVIEKMWGRAGTTAGISFIEGVLEVLESFTGSSELEALGLSDCQAQYRLILDTMKA